MTLGPRAGPAASLGSGSPASNRHWPASSWPWTPPSPAAPSSPPWTALPSLPLTPHRQRGCDAWSPGGEPSFRNSARSTGHPACPVPRTALLCKYKDITSSFAADVFFSLPWWTTTPTTQPGRAWQGNNSLSTSSLHPSLHMPPRSPDILTWACL